MVFENESRTDKEGEYQDCEETAATCKTSDGEEHVKGEHLVKKNMKALLESHSTVIEELSISQEMKTKHDVLARVRAFRPFPRFVVVQTRG